jgi:cytoskeleton protein RodZ
MQEINNNNEIQEVPKKNVSIGSLLVNARNAAALSQSDVAEQINLPKHIIQAIEADDYDNLPELTYVRGYLRNYARVVDVNDAGLIKLFNEQHQRVPKQEVTSRGYNKQSYDPAILWSTVAVLSILVGLVVTWWLDVNHINEQAPEIAETESLITRDKAGDALINIAQSPDSLVDNANHVAEFDHDAATRDLNEIRENDSNTSEVITEDQQLAMEEESQNPTLVSSVDGAQVLTVTYVEKSWTEIRDADANTLMQGLIEPGVVRNLSGKPPFEIFLGNAPGVVIEVNGLYFDHSQYKRSNRTARFQVSSGTLN